MLGSFCMLRTAIERNFRKISTAMKYDLKSILSLPEYIPQECLSQLTLDGISVYRANAQPIQYILDINKHIANRINNCKCLFPIWLKWEYLRPIFIMPGGTTEKGTKQLQTNTTPTSTSTPIKSISTGPLLLRSATFSTMIKSLFACSMSTMRTALLI